MKKFYFFLALCMSTLSLSAATSYYVAGTMNNWSHTIMTQDATNTDLWTYTFTATAKEYSFKITDGKWDSYEANYSNVDADSPIKLKGEGSGDIKFTPNAGDVVISFNASTQKVSVTMKDGNNPDPDAKVDVKYYVAGDIPGCAWDNHALMTQDATNTHIWRYTFTAEETTYEFKVTTGSTWYGYENIDKTSPINFSVSGGDNKNISITLGAGEASIIFNDSTKLISATGTAKTIDTENYYIKHPWNGGSWDWKMLNADANGTTYSITDVYGGDGCNWKKGETGSEQWISSPTLVGEPAIGDSATFTLDPAAGTITITKITATSVETTTTLTAPEKIIRNGQIYIVRENVLYTVTGQAVK